MDQPEYLAEKDPVRLNTRWKLHCPGRRHSGEIRKSPATGKYFPTPEELIPGLMGLFGIQAFPPVFVV